MNIIEVDSVSYTYLPNSPQKITAIKDISLSIKKGEILAIIGPTGCGKSTLVQHFNGLLKPSSGKVYVDGRDTSDKGTTVRSLCSRVGLVFQYPEYQLFEESVFNDVAFGPTKLGFSRAEIFENVKSSLELMGFNFERIKDRSPFSLSGGEMRRTAIAGVLAMKPEVLVLDEPTAGLDPENRTALINNLIFLNRKKGVTVILVSHSMDEVVEIADRLVVMHEGHISAIGEIHEVFSDERIASEHDPIVPQAARLLYNLKSGGVPVNLGAFKIDESVSEILRAFKAKKGKNR